ncbi:bacillithiol biosynthesis deacetylase BshB1 [Salibacterium salarium]|uniref:Bacillithiol biosynthesis deacetylase BshB1 n=2 Tax=Salibacterium salarium TaxID=284579 RepID=A0A3R9RE31_9BACI|nr:bacillithiol biosynthesis deacetylase BshB1 [Salibacterium salarium]RSL33440.1 bacillithiol biosynthesis deacetylase BshB1 [Salibacterium salarium]
MSSTVILCIGAHPDDVEIGMGGTVALHADKGDHVYVCSLTEGELSSNGTVENRQKEAEASASQLQVSGRYQLQFPDRGVSRTHHEYTNLLEIIRNIRPEVVFAPFYQDRHPDHAACSDIVRQAVFDAGIKKYPGVEYSAYKTDSLFYYFINGFDIPDFYVDISSGQERKESALSCYESQFVMKTGSVATPLTEGYIESVRSRDAMFGKQAGVRFAEGFKNASPLVFSSIPQRRTV